MRLSYFRATDLFLKRNNTTEIFLSVAEIVLNRLFFLLNKMNVFICFLIFLMQSLPVSIAEIYSNNLVFFNLMFSNLIYEI